MILILSRLLGYKNIYNLLLPLLGGTWRGWDNPVDKRTLTGAWYCICHHGPWEFQRNKRWKSQRWGPCASTPTDRGLHTSMVSPCSPWWSWQRLPHGHRYPTSARVITRDRLRRPVACRAEPRPNEPRPIPRSRSLPISSTIRWNADRCSNLSSGKTQSRKQQTIWKWKLHKGCHNNLLSTEHLRR